MNIIFGIIYLVYYIFIIGLGLAGYILTGLGFHRLCVRRGLSHPFLSWIPIANLWVLGNIADSYDTQNGKKKNRRTIMLVLGISVLILAVIFSLSIISVAMSGIFKNGIYPAAAVAASATSVVSAVISYILLLAVAVTLEVFTFISLYKLFKSSKPDLAVVFLVLSFFVPLAQSICVFICRNGGYDINSEKTAGSPYTIEEHSDF